jgi:hypothetical protein
LICLERAEGRALGKYTEQAGKEASVFTGFERRLAKWGVPADGFFDRMLKGGMFAEEICQSISDQCMKIVYAFDDVIVLEPEISMTYGEGYLWIRTHEHLFVLADLHHGLLDHFYTNILQAPCFVVDYSDPMMLLIYKSKGSMTLNVPWDYKFSKDDVILVKKPDDYQER